MTQPPGNSLDVDQLQRVADAGTEVADGLTNVLERVRQELDYNAAKGASPYRLGVHDGLRFAEDAIVDLLQRHGHDVASRPTDLDA
jgi:hypothetical protein